jgi:Ca2+-binding RTX toxin-like protein
VKTITASAVDVIGGAGNDTFISGGSGEKFTGNGGSDTFQGTSVNLNGDTITDLSSGDKILITDGNLAHFSFQQNGTTLTFDPDTSVSQTTRTITLSNAPTGRFIISADPVAGVDLTYYAPPPADFNGDGISDVLFQNSSGEPFIYEMNGTNVIGGGSLTNPGRAGTPKRPAISMATGTPTSCGRTAMARVRTRPTYLFMTCSNIKGRPRRQRASDKLTIGDGRTRPRRDCKAIKLPGD